jgi:hypothetical protein
MSTESTEDNSYETHDIYLAAYLKICGCTFKQRRHGQRVFFIFTNTAGSVKELREAYYQGIAKVSPHQFSQEIMAFKQLCF